MKSLEEIRSKIKEESKYVGIRKYSHNIIGLLLQEIEDGYGEGEAKKAIKDFHLDEKGWSL